MRCFVRKIGNGYHAAFDWSGVSYTHSLRTQDEKEAEVRLGPIRDTLYRLELGTLQMPPGTEAKAFILSRRLRCLSFHSFLVSDAFVSDGQLDGAVGQSLLCDLVPFLAGFDSRFFDGVDLKEAIELGLIAPGAVVVVEVDLPGRGLNNDGIGPVWQPNDQPANLTAKELCGGGYRRGQLEAATCGADG